MTSIEIRYITRPMTIDQIPEWPTVLTYRDEQVFWYTRYQGHTWEIWRYHYGVELCRLKARDLTIDLSHPVLDLESDDPESLQDAILEDLPAYLMRALL